MAGYTQRKTSHGLDVWEEVVRYFAIPPGLMNDLRRGAPDLAEVLVRCLLVNEEPDLHVFERSTTSNRPPGR